MVSEKPKQPWAIAARKIRHEISALLHGNRELGLKKIAGDGLNPQTLRRRVSAIEFLERFEKETKLESAVLETFPIAAVEFLSRWYRRDPSAARKAATKLIDGKLTVEQLRLGEKESRKSAFAGFGKSLEIDYKHQIETQIQSWFRHPLKEVERRKRFDPASLVDFTAGGTHGVPKTGILIVGPYSDRILYERRAFDWIAKAFTLLQVFEVIYLVLPDNAKAADFFLDWWRPLNIPARHLCLLQLPSGKVWPPDSRHGRS